MKSRYKRFNKKGFTLIELIVTIAILALLVLLALPRMMGYVDRANTAQIVNDIKVAEEKVLEHLIDSDDLSVIGVQSELNEIEGYKVYSKEGKINDGDIEIEEINWKLNEAFIGKEVSSNLGGVFYSNDNGSVILYTEEEEEDIDRSVSYTELTKYKDVKLKSFDGENLGSMKYKDDNKEIKFYGLNDKALDGDESTYHRSPGIITWDGNLTHQEITITGKGDERIVPSYSSSLLLRFLDENNEIVPEASTNKNSVKIAGYSNIETNKVVVPEGATKMELYSSNPILGPNADVYEVSISNNKERPKNAKIQSRTDSHSILMSWDTTNRAIITNDSGFHLYIKGNEAYLTPESFTNGKYKILLIDENGNGQEYNHTVNYENLLLSMKYEDILLSTVNNDRLAFDSDENTYSKKIEYVQLKPGAAHREITITGRGDQKTIGQWSSNLLVEFLDENNEVVPEAYTNKNYVKIAGYSKFETNKVLVPEGATKMRLYPSNPTYAPVIEVNEISISDTYKRPSKVKIVSKANNSNILFEWDGGTRTVVKENGKIIANTRDKSIILPPRSFNDNVYNFIVVDENGDGQEIKSVVKGDSLLLVTDDYSYQVFDNKLETFSEGSGILKLNKNLMPNKISITGRGNSRITDTGSLRARFKDDAGNIINEASTNKGYVTVGTVSKVGTVELTVPEGATQLEIYSSNSTYPKIEVYEISATR